MQEHLSDKLSGLRRVLFENSLKLVIAARSSDRDLLLHAHQEIDKCWPELDKLIKLVSALEQNAYNVAMINDMFNEDEE